MLVELSESVTITCPSCTRSASTWNCTGNSTGNAKLAKVRKSPCPKVPAAKVNVNEVRSTLRETVTSPAASPCNVPMWNPVVGLAGLEKCMPGLVRLIVTLFTVLFVNGSTASVQ